MLKVIADHREYGVGKRPFALDATRFDVVRGHLVTGDYTLAGLEDVVSVERKALADVVQSMIGDWLRLRKELYRLAGMDAAIIVVEANVSDLQQKLYEADANPNSVLGKCHACLIDHGVPVVFAGPKPYSEWYVERFLSLAAKKFGGSVDGIV